MNPHQYKRQTKTYGSRSTVRSNPAEGSIPSGSKPDSELLDIDPNGDLILDVLSEDTERSIRVSSKTLCLASPVFRALLGYSGPSSFQEAAALQANAGGAPTKIKLADDNYGALLVVLNAMHLRTRKIPPTVTIDSFYRIAIVCDKYDLAEILLPWVSVWTSCFRDITKKPGYERWFLISWVFRQSKIFNQVTRELMLNTRLDGDGYLVAIGFGIIEDGGIPDSVIDAIRNGRARIISSLISLGINEMDKYNSCILNGQHICNRWMYHSTSLKQTQCDAIAVGALHRCLLEAGIWPVQKSTKRRTAASIIKDLESIESFGSEIIETVSNKGNPKSTHADCGSKQPILIGIKEALNEFDGLKLSDFYSNDLIFFLDEESEAVEKMDYDDETYS